ncbi:MAG: glutamate 5-kinase [bacterium]|nr:glutamate 5-kinase [bacterium]
MSDRKRVVIKLGSSVLLNGKSKLDQAWILALATEIKKIHEDNDIVVVCSGAASEGKNHVQLTPEEKSKYTKIARRQLYAAVGQPYIVHAFIEAFDQLGITISQALLTRNTFSELNRYYNTTAVLNHMLEERIVPLINGNDVITTLELSAGGNDGLAAVVSIALDADRLVLMTDTSGVYDKNPFKDKTAKKFHTVKDPDVLLRLINNETSKEGIGGMYAKIEAARLAWYAGIQTVIANGMDLKVYSLLMDETPPGTVFIPPMVPSQSEQAKIRWFLSARNNYGSVIIDEGAEKAIKERKSLLGVGITQIEGRFRKGDIISIENEKGQIVACGMVGYDSEELSSKIKKKTKIEKPVVHANKLKLLYV